jgi:hypothetical protein
MDQGRHYLVRLMNVPVLRPVDGGWAQIRTPTQFYNVSPQDTATSDWASSVHVFALQDAPDPILGRDELVWRDQGGQGESRIIVGFTPL